MDIILLKDLDKVGNKHDIVNVKNGYGRNYLIPQGYAIVANASNRKQLNEVIKQEEAREAKKLDMYKAIADQLKDVVLRIGAKTGTSGAIFGSITNVQIANALKEQCNLDIERKKIVIEDEVKTVGEYTAKINLHKELQASVRFEVTEE
jgi:large subunit ribosomal protein L9